MAMLKWIKAVIKYACTPPKKESVLTKVVGFNDPRLLTPPVKSIEVSAKCRNCFMDFKETLYNVYAVKNSLYEYDYCSDCTDITTINRRYVTVNENGTIILDILEDIHGAR